MEVLAARAANLPTNTDLKMPMKQIFKDAFAYVMLPSYTIEDVIVRF